MIQAYRRAEIAQEHLEPLIVLFLSARLTVVSLWPSTFSS